MPKVENTEGAMPDPKDDRKLATEDLLNGFGLTARSRRRLPAEEVDPFLDRMSRELPEILLRAEGSIKVAAMVFDEDVQVVKDMVATYKHIRKARNEGVAIAQARELQDKKLHMTLKQRKLQTLEEEDNRTIRKYWPVDKDERLDRMRKVLPGVFIEYKSDLVMIASRLNLRLQDIQECLDLFEDLHEPYEQGLHEAEAAVASHLYNIAINSQSPQASIFWLKARAGDRWQDKKVIEVNKGAFGDSSNYEPPVSIFSVVNGDSEKSEK